MLSVTSRRRVRLTNENAADYKPNIKRLILCNNSGHAVAIAKKTTLKLLSLDLLRLMRALVNKSLVIVLFCKNSCSRRVDFVYIDHFRTLCSRRHFRPDFWTTRHSSQISCAPSCSKTAGLHCAKDEYPCSPSLRFVGSSAALIWAWWWKKRIYSQDLTRMSILIL